MSCLSMNFPRECNLFTETLDKNMKITGLIISFISRNSGRDYIYWLKCRNTAKREQTNSKDSKLLYFIKPNIRP